MIKITPADEAFSKCVREAASWCCERCGTYYPEDRRRGLHCSHFHGRGNWSVRLDPLNAFSHCYGCHRYFEANPLEFSTWVLDQIGEGAFEILRDKKNDTSLAKSVKRTKGKGEIAKHYRLEHKKLQAQRAEGIQGKLTFTGWV